MRSAIVSTIAPHGVDLRVEHLVHRDEVGTDDVPVDVLEGERQVVQRVQPLLQQADQLRGDLVLHAGHGERRGGGLT